MRTNMAGFSGFVNFLHPCALDESSISTGRVNECISNVVKTKLNVVNWKYVPTKMH